MSKTKPDEMSFFEHLEELRSRFLKSLIIWLIIFIVCLIFMKEIFDILAEPYLGIVTKDKPWGAFDPKEPFYAHIKSAFWASIILSSGIFFYQIWAFVAPGLEKKEKRFAIPFILFMALFFMLGCWFSFSVAYPMMLKFLIGWNIDGMDLYTRTFYLSLLFGFVIAMGVGFETPMFVFLLAKLGLVTPEFLLAKFKHAVLIIFVFAAVVTPTPDWLTQSILAGPMLILYLLGVAAAFIVRKKKPEDLEDTSENKPAIGEPAPGAVEVTTKKNKKEGK